MSSVEDTKSLTFDQLQEFVAQKKNNSKQVTILDVRRPDEYAKGHVESAVNLPVDSIPEALALGPEEFKNTYGFTLPSANSEAESVVVYCGGGGRAKRAFEALDKQNYKSNLFAYLPGWKEYSQKI